MTHESLINDCNYILQGIDINLTLEKAEIIKEMLKIHYNKNCKIVYHNYNNIKITGNAKISHAGDIETVFHNLHRIKSNIDSISNKWSFETGYYIHLLN